MAFGPDGCLYVCQAYKGASAVLQFTAPATGYTWTYNQAYVTPSTSPGLLHPYDLAFGVDGNLYVSSQDTNVVTGFYGPNATNPGTAMPSSQSLPPPTGQYYAGTIVPAHSWDTDKVPTPTPAPVHTDAGGLKFHATSSGSTHSVRGVAFDSGGNLYAADEANNRVVVYGPASANFPYLGAITTTGSNNEPLNGPVALWFDAGSGLLYIGSPGNERIYSYAVADLAEKPPSFLAHVVISDKLLDKLSGITMDPSGNLYTCSRKNKGSSKSPAYFVYQWVQAGGTFTTPTASFAGPFTDEPEQIVPVYSGFGSSP